MLKTYYEFDSILLLFPNIIDKKTEGTGMARGKGETGKTQTVRKEKIERQDRKERLD